MNPQNVNSFSRLETEDVKTQRQKYPLIEARSLISKSQNERIRIQTNANTISKLITGVGEL